MEPSHVLIPEYFRKSILSSHGKDGEVWLDQVPDYLLYYASQWKLTLSGPAANLTQNLVLFGQDEFKQDVVLKLGIPSGDLQSETIALTTFNGEGCVPLLKCDLRKNVLLVPRVRPGVTLEHLSLTGRDEEALHILHGINNRLHNQTCRLEYPNGVQTLTRWAQGFDRLKTKFNGTTGPFDSKIVTEASETFRSLLQSQNEPILLHGDLHHGNILAQNSDLSSWIAIDPQGVIGDPIFEISAFMRNPYPGIESHPHLKDLMLRRIDSISEIFSFDKKRVAAWAFAQTALASWWIYKDDGSEWKFWWELAHLFREIQH